MPVADGETASHVGTVELSTVGFRTSETGLELVNGQLADFAGAHTELAVKIQRKRRLCRWAPGSGSALRWVEFGGREEGEVVALRNAKAGAGGRLGLRLWAGLSFLAGLVAVLALAVACGGGSGDVAGTSTPEAPASPVATPTSTLPKELRERLEAVALPAGDISPGAVLRGTQDVSLEQYVKLSGNDVEMGEKLRQLGFEGAQARDYRALDKGYVLSVVVQSYRDAAAAGEALQYFRSQVPSYQSQTATAVAGATNVKAEEFAVPTIGEGSYGFVVQADVVDQESKQERKVSRSAIVFRERNLVVMINFLPAQDEAEEIRVAEAALARVRAAQR